MSPVEEHVSSTLVKLVLSTTELSVPLLQDADAGAGGGMGVTGSEQGPEGKAQTPEEIRRRVEAAAGGCTAGIQRGQQ